MTSNLSSIISDPDILLELEPEELAGVVLEFFNSIPNVENKNILHPEAFCNDHGLKGYPEEYREGVKSPISSLLFKISIVDRVKKQILKDKQFRNKVAGIKKIINKS